NSPPRALHTIRCVHQPQIKLRRWREPQLLQRPEVFVVRASHRNRQMDVRNLMPDAASKSVRNLDHLARVGRLYERLGTEVAVAKVKPELDCCGHRSADAHHSCDDLVLGRPDAWQHIVRLTIPDDHLVAKVPLYAEIGVRNCTTYRLDLAEHGLLIGRFDRQQIGCRAEGIDHPHGGRQADLKADMRWQLAATARRAEVEVRGSRFPGVSQFAESQFGGVDALRQAEQRKSGRLAHGPARVGPQERTRSQEGILKADPQAPRARLAVRHTLQTVTEHLADGTKYLVDTVEADTADEMDLLRPGFGHFVISHLSRQPAQMAFRFSRAQGSLVPRIAARV